MPAMESHGVRTNALVIAGWTGFAVSSALAVADAPLMWFFAMYPAMAVAAATVLRRG